MVSFTCDKCGNGFRKNQVESHMRQCGSRMVSCIDCSVNFMNDEFKSHIRCITESEKYESKSSYVQKANKGDIKQNAWFEKVVAAVETFRGSSRAKTLLEKLTEFPNIPRKKAKFFNFMKNSFRSFGIHDGLLEEVWNVIEAFDKKQAAEQKPVKPAETTQPAQSNDSKRKLNEVEGDDLEAEHSNKKQATESTKFDWIESSKAECAKQDDQQIKFKKLFKKILKSYKKTSEAESSEIEVEELKQKLVKKLRKKSSLFQLTEADSVDAILVKCVA